MNFVDKVLRLLGTNRVQLAWRWRRFNEGWDKKDARPAATPRVGRVGSVTWGGLIPEEFPLISTLLVGLSVAAVAATGLSGVSSATAGTVLRPVAAAYALVQVACCVAVLVPFPTWSRTRPEEQL